MNRYLIAFFIIVVTCFSACREDDVAPEQNKCKKIMEQLGSYKQKVIDFTSRNPQAGKVTGYFDGNELKLASSVTSTQRGRRKDDYFFHNNKLIAVKQEEYNYNQPKYLTKELAATTGDSVWFDETKTVMDASWCYFYSGHLVKWLDKNNKTVSNADPRFDELNDKMLQDAEKLKQMLFNQN